MEELRKLCKKIGFKNVRTYIQSGNVLFESNQSEAELVVELEFALAEKKAWNIPVIIRNRDEFEAVLAANPFQKANPARVGVLFLREPTPPDLMKEIEIPGREQVVVSGRELYIHYPDGMGRSKLKLPKTVAAGTMRNINTVARLVQKCRE